MKNNYFKRLMLTVLVIIGLISLVSCVKDPIDKPKDEPKPFGESWNENFVPDEGKVWMFVGQDLDAVGGLEDYNKGYVDFFGVPAGVTGYINMSLAGLIEKANWGSGDMQLLQYAQSETFKNVLIAIGLYCAGAELSKITSGQRDAELEILADFMKDNEDNKFFLRIGYEFDYPSNNYPEQAYIEAFRYIVDKLRELEVENFVSVWQSYGSESADLNANVNRLLGWYPGDDYVDWFAYSYFSANAYTGSAMRKLARDKNKPVFIAESTPYGYDLESNNGPYQWSNWFTNYINHIKANIGVIKAVHYINQDWDIQPQWRGQGWGNTKLQADPYIREKWAQEISKEDSIFVHKEVRINSEKEYVPEEEPVIVAPKASGTNVEAEWGKLTGAEIVLNELASNGKQVILTDASEAIELFSLPESAGLSIAYLAEGNGIFEVTVGGKTYEVPFEATGDDFEAVEVLDGDKRISLGPNEKVKISLKEGENVAIDNIYLKSSTSIVFRLTGTEIDVNSEHVVAEGNTSLYTIGNAASLYVSTISNSDGSGSGSLTFTSPVEGSGVAIVFAKGPDVDNEGQTLLYVNGENVKFTHLRSGDWNSFQAYIIETEIKVGDTITVDRGDPAFNQPINIDGIFIFDLGIFDGSVDTGVVEEPKELIPPAGAHLTPDYALLDGAVLNEEGSATLANTDDSIVWYNLPSFYEAYIVYSTNQNGNIGLYINDYARINVQVRAASAVNPFRVVKVLAGTFTDAGRSLRIKVEEGDVSVTIHEIILGGIGYGDNAPYMKEPAVREWLGGTDPVGYPPYTNLVNTSVSFNAQKAGDTFAIIGTSDRPVEIKVTINGITKSITPFYSDWQMFNVTFLYFGDFAQGTEVTVEIVGNVNLNAVYSMKKADLHTPDEGQPTEPVENLPTLGTHISSSYAQINSGTKNEDGTVSLGNIGDNLIWYHLPSYYEAYIIYSADQKGTISFYINDYEKITVQVKASTSVNPIRAVKILPGVFMNQGWTMRIKVEEGDVPVTIHGVMLGGVGYGDNAPLLDQPAVREWLGTNDPTNYPPHNNLVDTTLKITLSQDADMLAIVAAAGGSVDYKVTINNETFVVHTYNGDWNLFTVAYLYVRELAQGTEVTIEIAGNSNVNAVYSLQAADFSTN